MPFVQFKATVLTPYHRREMINQVVEIEIELQQLLHTEFRPNSPTELCRVFEWHFREFISSIGDKMFQYQLGRFRLLEKQLKRVRNSRPDLFHHFRDEFHDITEKQYFGWRLEVGVVSVLIKNDIEFTKPDIKPAEEALPDIRIDDVDAPLKIEITSKHMESAKNRDLRYQIGRALRSKIDDEYCDENTAIFIDITNIQYHSLAIERELDEEAIKSYLRQELEDENVGSVYVFVFTQESERDRFSMNHFRVDNDCINSELENFLDERYDSENYDYDGNIDIYASA